MKVLIITALALLPAVFGACAQHGEYFDIENKGKAEWRLAFRATAYNGESALHVFRHGSQRYVEPGCKTANWRSHCTAHYRNHDALNNFHNVKDVKLVIFKDGAIRRVVNFKGNGQSYQSWFSRPNYVSSCWHDLKNSPMNFFSLDGHSDGRHTRHFFMERNYGGCPNDRGWFVVLDGPHAPCQWEKRVNRNFPKFLYSPYHHSINWNEAGVAYADGFAIFLRYNTAPAHQPHWLHRRFRWRHRRH